MTDADNTESTTCNNYLSLYAWHLQQAGWVALGWATALQMAHQQNAMRLIKQMSSPLRPRHLKLAAWQYERPPFSRGSICATTPKLEIVK